MIRESVKFIVNNIIAEKNHLSMLDTKIGDGDHGLNMSRGATAALEAIEDLDDDELDISLMLNTVGQAFIMNVGGASGPLYGTGFIEASKVVNKNSELNLETFEKIFEVAIAGVQRRGHANKGDKTMLDVLIPVYDSLKSSRMENKKLNEALDEAMTAAREGVEYTKTITAKRGRAAYMGDRSLGFEDPGAVSSMILFRSICQFLKDNKLI